ncbi:MAG TPA: hypothetical protein VJQ56_02560 [Blastocatellia bacterium]|nr:hypothetical protein [Blastocatellia bacterium]
MNDKGKADIERLETLRELALCGPEEKREEAHRAYEELRQRLFSHEQCETPDESQDTKELTNGR